MTHSPSRMGPWHPLLIVALTEEHPTPFPDTASTVSKGQYDVAARYSPGPAFAHSEPDIAFTSSAKLPLAYWGAPHRCQPGAQASAGVVHGLLEDVPQGMPDFGSERLLRPVQVASHALIFCEAQRPSQVLSAQPDVCDSPVSEGFAY